MSVIFRNPIISAAGIKFESILLLPLKKLDNFKREYRIPNPKSHASLAFIGGLVREIQEQKLKKLHAVVRSEFKLKRKDIDVTFDDHGMAILECPTLRYESSYRQSDENPELLQHIQRLDEISDLNLLLNDEFNESLGLKFSLLGFPLVGNLDIESLIDRIEDLPECGSSIQVDYGFDASHCEITLADSACRLSLRPRHLDLHSETDISARDLLKHFNEFQEKLVKAFEDIES